MKRIYEIISSNERQIFEIVALIFVTFIPWFFDLPEIFKEYLANNPISPDHFLWQFALREDELITSIILVFVSLMVVRKVNREFVMNRNCVYHDYCYAWYWFWFA